MRGIWYYRQSGRVVGPVVFDDLAAVATSGRLSPNDDVRSGRGDWQPAHRVVELRDLIDSRQPDSDAGLVGVLSAAPDFEGPIVPATASALSADDIDDDDVLAYLADDRDFEPKPLVAPAEEVGAPSPPALPDTAPVAKSAQPARVSKREMTLPLSRIGYVAAGIAVVAAAAFFLWPKPARTVRGTVTVDGTPIPLGTISIVPKSPSSMNAMSLPIVDGDFRATHNPLLPDGKYEITVVVGNELGMPVARIEDSPLAALNGARFRIAFDASDTENSRIILRFTSRQAVKLDRRAGSQRR